MYRCLKPKLLCVKIPMFHSGKCPEKICSYLVQIIIKVDGKWQSVSGKGSTPTEAVINATRNAKPFNRKKYWQSVNSHHYHKNQYLEGNKCVSG